MPSTEHEILVALVRERPALVLSLLRMIEDLELEPHLEVLDRSESLGDVQPPERRADAVLVVRDERTGAARIALVVEIQLRIDPRKREVWPAYVTAARQRWGCPTALVVLTMSDDVCTWCREPIPIDWRGSVLLPIAYGPSTVPIVDGPDAIEDPALALVSLLAHRDGPEALEIARAVLAACGRLDDDQAALYADVIFGFLGVEARQTLEAEMNLGNFEPRSEFLRRLKASGIAEGRVEGREEGRVEALRRALLRLLEQRAFALEPQQRSRIDGCSDPEQLEQWLLRAASVSELAEVFAP